MAHSAEVKVYGEVVVKSGGDSAATKAKIDSIWEELNGKIFVPAEVGLPKMQVVKPSKSSKVVPSWMASLGLVPPRRAYVHKPDQSQGDKLLKFENWDATNRLPKDSSLTSGQNQVQAKESRKLHRIDLKVNEVCIRLRERVDSNTPLNDSEDTKNLMNVPVLRRKSENLAPSSSGLDVLIEKISKKPKPSVLDRTRMEWGQFKEEKGFEDELEVYKRSGDKYLDKIAFLHRSDVREYENERDARLALQSKRQSETSL